jgi:UDP-glucose 4-epimerase
LAERIVELLGSGSTITLVPYEQAYSEGYEDMRRRVPDNSKSFGLVGFEPKTTLDEIILNVAADYKPAKVLDPAGWKITLAS